MSWMIAPQPCVGSAERTIKQDLFGWQFADCKQTASPTSKTSSSTENNVNGEMYIADGDYIKDIEVNDLRNRYTLTKGSTQKMVNIL